MRFGRCLLAQRMGDVCVCIAVNSLSGNEYHDCWKEIGYVLPSGSLKFSSLICTLHTHRLIFQHRLRHHFSSHSKCLFGISCGEFRHFTFFKFVYRTPFVHCLTLTIVQLQNSGIKREKWILATKLHTRFWDGRKKLEWDQLYRYFVLIIWMQSDAWKYVSHAAMTWRFLPWTW